VPEFADREFWSVVLLSNKYAVQPDVIYSLITSDGDHFVDSNSNPIVAASHPMGRLLTALSDNLVTSDGDTIQYAEIN
jgi:hypothetical protein